MDKSGQKWSKIATLPLWSSKRTGRRRCCEAARRRGSTTRGASRCPRSSCASFEERYGPRSLHHLGRRASRRWSSRSAGLGGARGSSWPRCPPPIRSAASTSSGSATSASRRELDGQGRVVMPPILRAERRHRRRGRRSTAASITSRSGTTSACAALRRAAVHRRGLPALERAGSLSARRRRTFPSCSTRRSRWLAPERGGLFVDCTVGPRWPRRGAARAADRGRRRLVGIDRDPGALDLARGAARARSAAASRLVAGATSPTSTRRLRRRRRSDQVDGVFADLGVSSLQLDRAERGFSFSARWAARHAHGCRRD